MSEPTKIVCPKHGRWTYLANTPQGPQRRACPECPGGFSVPPEEAQEREGTLFSTFDLDVPPKRARNPYEEAE